MEEKKTKARFELVEVPSQYTLGFRDNSTEEVMDSNQLLLKIANRIEEVLKAVS